jgi:hypothetical protein
MWPRSRALAGARVEVLWVKPETVACLSVRSGLDALLQALALVMFSFGPITTNTALGGGLLRIRVPSIRSAVREVQCAWPVQRGASFFARMCKYSVLKLLTYPPLFGAFAARMLLQNRGLLDAVEFLMPTGDEGALPSWCAAAGLGLFNLLGGRPKDARRLTAIEVAARAPGLSGGSAGGHAYTEACTDDARLVLQVLRDAALPAVATPALTAPAP